MANKKYKLTFKLYDGTSDSVVFEVPEGPKGDKGDDYVLTDADKAEIAEMAAELVEIPEGSGDISVTGATVGQTVKIAEVDANGVPTAWEAVDFPGEERYELIETIVCDGTYGNIDKRNLSLKKAKIYFHMAVGTAAFSVGVEGSNDAGLFGYAWLGNLINTGERFANVLLVSDGRDAYAELVSPATTTINTAAVNRTSWYQNADTPIKRIIIYVSGGSQFPAGSTIEIWGVRA